MSISTPEASITSVATTDEHLVVGLDDGREVRTPLAWYPRLLAAPPEDRARWELIGGGEAVSWPALDEDLSLYGMLRGVPAPDFRPDPPEDASPAEAMARNTVAAALDFYGESLAQAKAHLYASRSQLTDMLDQIPESASAARDRVAALAGSFEPILEAIDDDAYAHGVENTPGFPTDADEMGAGNFAGVRVTTVRLPSGNDPVDPTTVGRAVMEVMKAAEGGAATMIAGSPEGEEISVAVQPGDETALVEQIAESVAEGVIETDLDLSEARVFVIGAAHHEAREDEPETGSRQEQDPRSRPRRPPRRSQRRAR